MTIRLVPLILLASTAVPLAVQEPGPFRTETNLVSVYATVVDADGRLVTDLTRDDFEVRDNGRRQTLTAFSNEPQPFSVVMMLDRSGSMADHFPRVREAGLEFVSRMRSDDQARIGSFGRNVTLSPADFTNDGAVLANVLRDELQDLGPSPVWLAIDRAVATLDPLDGRRVVLVFTDGRDEPGLGQRRVRLDDVLNRVRASDVMVYAIGFATEVVRTRRVLTPGVPWPLPGGRAFPSMPQVLPGVRRSTVVEPPDPGLRRLADASGGGYFEFGPGDDLTAVFARVADELHQQYWLGFAPVALDGQEHRIDVDVDRRGVEVRARRTYVAR